jgi:hypothetical protein
VLRQQEIAPYTQPVPAYLQRTIPPAPAYLRAIPLVRTRIILPPETIPATRDFPTGNPTALDVIPPRRELNAHDTTPRGNPRTLDVVPLRRDISPLPGAPAEVEYPYASRGGGARHSDAPASPSPRSVGYSARVGAIPIPGRRVDPVEPPKPLRQPIPLPYAPSQADIPPIFPEAVPPLPSPVTPRPVQGSP